MTHVLFNMVSSGKKIIHDEFRIHIKSTTIYDAMFFKRLYLLYDELAFFFLEHITIMQVLLLHDEWFWLQCLTELKKELSLKFKCLKYYFLNY